LPPDQLPACALNLPKAVPGEDRNGGIFTADFAENSKKIREQIHIVKLAALLFFTPFWSYGYN
jgi:hypothetical protein